MISAARASGLWIAESEIRRFGDLVSKRTGESEVYWNHDERAFYKIKNPAAKQPIKRTSPTDWPYEHVIHNILFPETRYEFVGIMNARHEIRVVLKQSAIVTETFPEEREIADELSARGLYPCDRYFFGDGHLAVTDVGAHGDNVLKSDEGRLCFIDPLIRLEQPAEAVIEWLTGYNPESEATK